MATRKQKTYLGLFNVSDSSDRSGMRTLQDDAEYFLHARNLSRNAAYT